MKPDIAWKSDAGPNRWLALVVLLPLSGRLAERTRQAA